MATPLITVLNILLYSFLTVTGYFSVMIGIFLYGFGSCECHSKLKNRYIHPLETDTKGRHSSSLTFL